MNKFDEEFYMTNQEYSLQEGRQDSAREGVVFEKLDETALSMVTGRGDPASSKGGSSLPLPKIVESHSEFQVVKDKPNLGGFVRENYFTLRDTVDHKVIPGKTSIGLAPAKEGWVNIHLAK
jgi:hypothetical protein